MDPLLSPVCYKNITFLPYRNVQLDLLQEEDAIERAKRYLRKNRQAIRKRQVCDIESIAIHNNSVMF